MNLKQRYRIFSALLAIALALVFALLPGCSGNPAKDQEAVSVFAYENYFNELSELIQNTWRDDYIASIELRLDDPEMIVNGETVVIDSEKETAPYLSDNGTIMLPIQALAELLGIEIDSDDRFAPVAAVEEILLFDAIEAAEGRRVILTKPYQMHRLVVKTSDPSVFEQLEGVTHTVSGPDNTYVIQFGDEKAAKTAAEQLKHSREVQLTEPDVLMSIDTNNYRSWGVQHIGADQYKTFLSPVNNLSVVTVAVLDTGVDATHPFLAGRVISGWCYITNNNNPYDMQGHGTHVAGTIAESTHENVRIMPVKVLGDNGAGSMLTAHMGILWAVENGADVINMSLGGAGEHQYIRDAIIYANSNGTVGPRGITIGETATERALELLTISHHAAWGGGTQFVTDNGNARIVLLLLDNGDKAIRFDNQNYHRALIIVFENNVATYFSFSEHNVTW